MGFEQILCLANSYKHDHRCVAGIHLDTKRWVRLVGRDVPGCLTLKQTCYADGTEAAILDVFEAELGEKCGSKGHPEDVFVEGRRWRPVRRFDGCADKQMLKSLLGKGPGILQGYGNRVYARKFEKIAAGASLELVKPEDLWWWIRDENGKRKNRALFRLGHVSRIRYDLPITDPVWLNQLESLPAGIYAHSFFFRDNMPETLFTISLSEPFDGFHYKLVAAVINLQG